MIQPLDVKKCQAEVPNGYSFMTIGGIPGRVRCSNAPSYVVVEKKPGEDGEHGAMTLCESCYQVYCKQIGVKDTLVFQIKE